MNTQNVYTYAIQYQKFKLIYPHNMKDSENTTNYISMMYIKQSNSKNKQTNQTLEQKWSRDGQRSL